MDSAVGYGCPVKWAEYALQRVLELVNDISRKFSSLTDTTTAPVLVTIHAPHSCARFAARPHNQIVPVYEAVRRYKLRRALALGHSKSAAQR